MKTKLSSSLLLALGFSTAFAGTMGAVEPAIDFGGLYFGLGSGFTTLFGSESRTVTHSDGRASNNASQTDRETFTNILFTGDIGYGKMVAEKTYLGGKASLYYSPFVYSGDRADIKADRRFISSEKSTTTRSMQPTYNLDLMLGYEIIPHVLPFVEAGVSFANMRHLSKINGIRLNLENDSTHDYSHSLTMDGYKTSYNVGIGSYFLVQKNWFFSTELVYNGMGTRTSSSTRVVPGNPIDTINRSNKSSYDAVSLFAGVSYLFPV